VGREQHRAAAGGLGVHRLPEGPPRLDVHPGGRLVEHDQVGLRDDRHREPDPLLLAAGQALEDPVRQIGDAGPFERLVDRQWVRMQRGDQADQFADLGVLDDPAALQHRADLAGRDRLGGRVAVHLDGPAVGPDQAEQDLDGGGLARTVRPQDRDHLAGPDGQVDAGDRLDLAVSLGHAGEADRVRVRHTDDDPGARVRGPGPVVTTYP
jgi:hypothetical protein